MSGVRSAKFPEQRHTDETSTHRCTRVTRAPCTLRAHERKQPPRVNVVCSPEQANRAHHVQTAARLNVPPLRSEERVTPIGWDEGGHAVRVTETKRSIIGDDLSYSQGSTGVPKFRYGGEAATLRLRRS
jgi:hypothetical protein